MFSDDATSLATGSDGSGTTEAQGHALKDHENVLALAAADGESAM